MDSDDIQQIISNLKIQETNHTTTKITALDITEGLQKNNSSLLGKFITAKNIEVKNLRIAMEKSWGTNKFKVVKLSKNFFQFLFEASSEQKRILADGPWCFDNYLLVLQRWKPSLTSESEAFDSTLFWIYVQGLPMQLHTENVGKKIATSLSDCIFFQIREDMGTNLLSFRFRANLNLTAPLPQLISIVIDDSITTSNTITGMFQYERLPSICFSCGLVGHTAKICPSTAEEFNLWTACVPPKIRAFLWRISINSLPCGANLLIRKISDGICPICRNSIESWSHCLFDCPWIRNFWKCSDEFKDIAAMRHNSFLDLCYYLATHNHPSTDLFFTTLWMIWLERNNTVFQSGHPSCKKIEALASSMLTEYQQAVKIDSSSICLEPLPSHWVKPLVGSVKSNVDACYRNGIGTVGVAIRDCNGSLLCALSINIGKVPSVEFAECYAILCGTLEAARVWSGHITVESDSSLCIARLNSDEEDISPIGSLIIRIKRACRLAKSCTFSHIRRSCNVPADQLANLGFSIPNSLSNYCNWGTKPPPCIVSALFAEF